MDALTATSALPADPSQSRRRLGWRRRLRRATIVVSIVLLIGAAVFHRPLFFGNVGVVDPGRVYRAAQPKANLDQLLDDHRIATILNLRGGSVKDDWYRDELEAAKQRGIAFYDVSMSATQRPRRRDLLAIIDVLNRGEPPILIHCKQGADRTGLACAIYRMVRENQPPEQAEREFSLLHAHIPLFGPERLHEPLREYAEWLRSQGFAHDPERFAAWVREAYQADDPLADYRTPTPGPRRR